MFQNIKTSFTLITFVVLSIIMIAFLGIKGSKKVSIKSQDKVLAEFKETLPTQVLLEDIGLSEKDIFDRRYEYYLGLQTKLDTIQFRMIVLTIIALLLLIFKTDKLDLPVLSISVPSGVVYLLVFFAGMYLWANLGLTLNACNNSRLSLHAILKTLESEQRIRVHYYHSLEHTLSDASLLDNWFSYYFDIFKRLPLTKDGKNANKILGWVGLFVIYGYFFGLYLASILISTYEYYKRKSINKFVAILMFSTLIIFFSVSTMAFSIKMPYSNHWMMTIWIFAAIGILTWIFYGDKLIKDNRSDEEKLADAFI